MYRNYTWGDSDVIQSKTVTAAMLEVHNVVTL